MALGGHGCVRQGNTGADAVDVPAVKPVLKSLTSAAIRRVELALVMRGV